MCSTTLLAAEHSAAGYAVLRRCQASVITLLLHYHEAHEQCLGQRRQLVLDHFRACTWLRLALLHVEKRLPFTLEYDLRQYLKLPVAVKLSYFHDHISL